MKIAKLGLLLVVAYAGACSVTIAEGAPMPNVLIARSQARLALTFAPAVQEVGEVPNPSTAIMHTAHWRGTLSRGFHNAFGAYFQMAPDAEHADLVLVVLQASPSFVYAADANVAQVRYQAELTDGHGHVLARWADTAVSRVPLINWWSGTVPALSSAVEVMYEAIGKDLPSKIVTPPSARL